MVEIQANSKNRTERTGGGWAGPVVRTCGLAALLLAGAVTGLALEPSTPLAGYGRQAWVMENGLPQNTVQALVQTRQGFVWLGTEVGLGRFDGNGVQVFDRNSSPALPGNDVRCLLETRDGALWIGTSDGLARWKDGTVTAFAVKDGLQGNGIRALVEAANGVLWVWTDQGLARLEEERFVAATAGLPAGAIIAVTSDGQGVLWVATPESAAYYREGHWTPPELQLRLQPSFPKDGVQFLQTVKGGVAVASKSTVVVLRGASDSRGPHPGAVCRPGGQRVDGHQRRAGAAGWGQGATAAGDRCAGDGFSADADGRPRGQHLGRDRDGWTAHTARSAVSQPWSPGGTDLRCDDHRGGGRRGDAVGGNGRRRGEEIGRASCG